jgi:hypothetical protein
VSDLILPLARSQSHVFLLNSRLGLFTAASPSLEEASLLPKLQDHFAEFLSCDSLEPLRILSLTTCVGLRYGLFFSKRLAGFLDSLIRYTIPVAEAVGYYRVSAKSAYLTTVSIPTPFNEHFRPLAVLSLLCHCITPKNKCGNINPLSIDVASRPSLRSRLTLLRLALSRKP